MVRATLGLLVVVVMAAEGRTVKLRGRGVVELEAYVAAVVAGEAGVLHELPEALKAMAVAARTFAVANPGRHRGEGFDLCETPHCQRVLERGVSAKIAAAVEATEAELIWWQGSPAQIFYHRHCAGQTEPAATLWPALAAPYLRGVADSFCLSSGRANWSAEVQARELVVAAKAASGRVRLVRLDGEVVEYDAFRQWSQDRVKSAWFSVRAVGAGRFRLEGVGAGHGVGLCQEGAGERARQGHGYRDILNFYFAGTRVGVSAQGIPWRTMRGERVEMWSTQPDRDGAALEAAERALAEAERRAGRRIGFQPRLRVFPTVAMFRDATGEPGWVAASTAGRTVRTQPGPSAATLLHEFLHVVTEDRARPGLPRWFQEGLVLHLAREGDAVAPGVPEAARREYAEFRGRVRRCVERYGEAAVLAWIERGLPAEVVR